MQERLLALTRDKYSFLQSEAVKSLAGAVAHPQVQQRLFAVTWQLEWGLDYFLFFILPMIGFALGYGYSLGFLIIFKWVGIWGMLLYPIALLGMFLVPGIVYIVIKCIYLFWVDPMPSWQRKTIGETALKALRGWKGPVPRFILWRVAYLAALSRGRNAERVETLATLLELREEQRRRPGS